VLSPGAGFLPPHVGRGAGTPSRIPTLPPLLRSPPGAVGFIPDPAGPFNRLLATSRWGVRPVWDDATCTVATAIDPTIVLSGEATTGDVWSTPKPAAELPFSRLAAIREAVAASRTGVGVFRVRAVVRDRWPMWEGALLTPLPPMASPGGAEGGGAATPECLAGMPAGSRGAPFLALRCVDEDGDAEVVVAAGLDGAHLLSAAGSPPPSWRADLPTAAPWRAAAGPLLQSLRGAGVWLDGLIKAWRVSGGVDGTSGEAGGSPVVRMRLFGTAIKHRG
jgi:hypothetical protein